MKKNNLKEPQIWNLICEQIDKVRFKKTPNPWLSPIKENSEFSYSDEVKFYSPEVFRDKDTERTKRDKKLVRTIKKQLRKKKSKKNINKTIQSQTRTK